MVRREPTLHLFVESKDNATEAFTCDALQALRERQFVVTIHDRSGVHAVRPLRHHLDPSELRECLLLACQVGEALRSKRGTSVKRPTSLA